MRKLRNYVYPFPVYQAHFDNGHVARWALGVPEKATPADMIARGRQVARTFARPVIMDARTDLIAFDQASDQQVLEYWIRSRHRFLGAKLIHGYLEDRRYPGRPWHVDDMSDDATSVARQRITKKDWQAVMAALLAEGQNGGVKPATAAKASELLAA